eukprot:m51a1_g495 hypothetical protein (438) ;mRNA; f:248883-250346
MEIGLLMSGVINTVVTKAADNSYSVGWGGQEHAFNHPWTQTLYMFIAETFVLMIFITHKLITRRRKSDKPHRVETFFELFPPILIVPTILDLLATGVSSIALLYIDASVWQMLTGSLIVFSTILARIFFKRKPLPYKIIGIAVSVIGLVLVGLSSVFTSLKKASDASGASSGSSGDGDGGDKVTVWKIIVGIVLTFVAQLMTAGQVTIEERLLKHRNMNPAQVSGMEGFFGLVLSCFIVLPVVYFCPGDNPSSMRRGSYDNAIDAFMQMGHNIPLLFYVLIYILFDAVYNWLSVNIEKYLSAVHYCIIDACRSIFVWAWQLICYYRIEERFGEEWTKWSAFEVAGFVCLTIGTLLFHGIVKIPGMSYADLEEEAAQEEKERQKRKGEPASAVKDCELGEVPAPELNSDEGDIDLNIIDVKRDSMADEDGITVKRDGT